MKGELTKIKKQTKSVVSDVPDSLYIAVQKGDIEKIKNLLNEKIDLNIRYKNNQTILHIAAEQGNIEIVKLLVESGVNIFAKNDKGATSLRIAAHKKHSEIVKFLSSTKSLLNEKNDVKNSNLLTSPSPTIPIREKSNQLEPV